ncbi:hypothetical protein [Olleya sp. R77988]|uniref:hypothetical protein n=1 Tax=Olleya sp. R77988 TaxID=3093875 RepID=UPI0037C67F37
MNTTILENHRGMTNVHPLASFPFRSRPQQDLKPIYFPGGETKKIQDITVTSDVGTDPNRIQHIASVKAFFDKNKDDKFSPFDDVFGYNIELYFSKDAIKLDKAFKEVEVDEKGMIFFIEDNTDDISAQFCKIKIGRRVKDNLTDISQLYNSKSVYDYINSFVTIDKELFQELIIHGKLENVALKAVEFLFTAGNYFNPLAISKPIIEGLGTICHHISSFIDKGKLDDYRWNPNAKKLKEDGTEDTEHKFKPFLFPFVEDYLDQIDDSKINEYAVQSFTEFKSGFLKYDKSIRDYIEKTDFGQLLDSNIYIPINGFGLVNIPLKVDIIPDSAEAFLYSKYIQVSDAISNKLNDLETFDFTDLIKKGIRVANAFLCGIWNGLIDAISGIFKMFEMVFKGVVAMVDFTDNFSTQFPILMEYIDNAIDAIKNIDFNLLYTHFKTKIKNATQSFETIAYFSGAFIGFVVGLVIEIVGGLLISGGTLSIAAVLEKLASLFTSVLKGIAKAGKKALDFGKKLVINTFKGFRKLLDQLIAFLRKGTKGFKEMIDSLFEKINKTIKRKKYGKVTRAIIKKEMPKDFLNALKKLGFRENDILDYFTRYHNENKFKFLNEIEELIEKYPKLSKTDIYAIWGYTTNLYYGNLNRWLRLGKNKFKTKELSKIITSALEKMPKYNGTAFRALEFSEQSLLIDFLKKHKKGKTVNYKEFVSCGSNTKAAFFDKPKKNVFLKLEVKNAPIISDFADGVKIRGYAKEELLLLQNRKFVVKNTEKIGDKYLITLIEK